MKVSPRKAGKWAVTGILFLLLLGILILPAVYTNSKGTRLYPGMREIPTTDRTFCQNRRRYSSLSGCGR